MKKNNFIIKRIIAWTLIFNVIPGFVYLLTTLFPGTSSGSPSIGGIYKFEFLAVLIVGVIALIDFLFSDRKEIFKEL